MKVPLFAQHERGQRDRFILSPKVLSEAAGQTYAEHRALLGKEGSVNRFKTIGLDLPFPKLKMVSRDFGVHPLDREARYKWGKLWLAECGGRGDWGEPGLPGKASSARAGSKPGS